MTTMLRVSDETRERVLKIAKEDFNGASAEETLRRLLDEHWQAKCVAAMDHFRITDPQGWADYLNEAATADEMTASISEPWDEDQK